MWNGQTVATTAANSTTSTNRRNSRDKSSCRSRQKTLRFQTLDSSCDPALLPNAMSGFYQHTYYIATQLVEYRDDTMVISFSTVADTFFSVYYRTELNIHTHSHLAEVRLASLASKADSKNSPIRQLFNDMHCPPPSFQLRSVCCKNKEVTLCYHVQIWCCISN